MSHLLLASLVIYLSFKYLLFWAQEAMMPVIVTLFFAFPVLIIGILFLSFDGYRNIPLLSWVGTGMMVFVGLMFIAGIAFR